MDEYGAICKKLAVKHGCCLVDLQEVFNRYFEYRHSSYIAWDRVHPNLIGATVIAKAFLSHCGFEYDHQPAKKKRRPVKRQSVHRFFACTNRGLGYNNAKCGCPCKNGRAKCKGSNPVRNLIEVKKYGIITAVERYGIRPAG